MSMDRMAYSAMTAKICGMKANLLKKEDYRTLASMKSVPEAISWLCDHTVYGKCLKELDVSFYHRGNIEKILVNSLYDDCRRIYHFANKNQKTFLKLYVKKYESRDVNADYFSDIWKKGKKLPNKREQKIYLNHMGNEIDLLNLQWIYRAKKYYQLPEQDIYPMLIPIQYKLTVNGVRKLCEASGAEEFMRILNEETYYGKKYHFDAEHSIEKMADVWLDHVYEGASRKNPYSIAGIYHYLFRKEKEIDTITTAMECIRYGLSETEIMSYIQRPVWRDYQGGNDQ